MFVNFWYFCGVTYIMIIRINSKYLMEIYGLFSVRIFMHFLEFETEKFLNQLIK